MRKMKAEVIDFSDPPAPAEVPAPEPAPAAQGSPFAEIAALDRTVHDPSRLAILSALLGWAEADFQYLLKATALTKGNLSSHLGKLEGAGLVEIRKGFTGKKSWTRIRLTGEGRRRVEAHWQEIDRIRADAASWV